MEAFINGIGIISSQNIPNTDLFPKEIINDSLGILKLITPDYKDYIDLMARRRMGRIIKAGVTAAKMCLNDAGLSQPDAIITGTGLGCIEDTEKFLASILQNNERLLNPVHFMQSTYNTLSSQIAIVLNCNNYNNTFVHRSFSFESAIQDALMLIAEKETQTALVGSIDEITQNHYLINRRLNKWKTESLYSLDLFNKNSPGTVPGEGAIYFLLSDVPATTTYSILAGVKMFYKPQSPTETENKILQFLKECDTDIHDIDMIITGINGDNRFDGIYTHLLEGVFLGKPHAGFKHLCGEYFTATSFAVWLASVILKNQEAPSVCVINHSPTAPLRNILIWNHNKNINHSVLLIKKYQ
ncbi:MAG: beta-ketoacyl synthase chain length factor [Lentimicrobiaceae bacterium]|nr:beta-ketoacyl synthase chain length factor [Lentimicrobiaceae bacterium]